MITKIEEFQKQYDDFLGEFINRIKCENKQFPTVNLATRLDKPMKIYTNNREDYNQKVYIENDNYALNFPRFNQLQKTYDNDLAWYLDSDTVFFFERPFTNKVIRVLKKLLPKNHINILKNDIIIDGVKVGPTLICGAIDDYTGINNKQNSGVIYCLRWSNLKNLDIIFNGNNNHEARKKDISRGRIGTLDEFLDITKNEFEILLEKGEGI